MTGPPMSKTRIILIVCGSILLIHMLWIYSQLPETVASHFDGQGKPNAWMGKGVFLVFEIALLLFVVGEMLLVPRMISRLPNSLMNLPKKEYWLLPERREETFATFRKYFEVFGSAILVLVTSVNHLVYMANVNRQNLSNNIWYILIAFLAFVGIWLAKFIMEFTRKK